MKNSVNFFFSGFKLKRGGKVISKIDKENKRIYTLKHAKTGTIEEIAILFKVI